MTEQNGAEIQQPITPQIVITFGPGLNDVHVAVTQCSPFQMWGASRMLEQYAEDAWQTAQMQQAMAQAQAQVDVPPKVQPLDHLPPARRD